MEAKVFHTIQSCKWADTRNTMGRFNRVSCSSWLRMMHVNLQSNRGTHHKVLTIRVLSSLNNSPGSALETGGYPASLDETLVLKNKATQIEPLLSGRCVYLVGMMGSGKTTIGKVLSEAISYSFSDSDSFIEQKAGGISVAEIFEQHGEGYFRDLETEVLKEQSMMHRFVISTGGGAVIRPVNWKHMRSGISVWLDVPLECLARRISAVGTGSRPLLRGEPGDAYSKALTRLSTLLEERGEAYANANVRVSLEDLALKLGYLSVDNISPAAIAIEVLEQIQSFLKG